MSRHTVCSLPEQYGQVVSTEAYPASKPWPAGVMVLGPCSGFACCRIWSSRKSVHTNVSMAELQLHRFRQAPWLLVLMHLRKVKPALYHSMMPFLRTHTSALCQDPALAVECPILDLALFRFPARVVRRRVGEDGTKIDNDYVARDCVIRNINHPHDSLACSVDVTYRDGRMSDNISIYRVIKRAPVS